ncbi:MAG: UDP-N-acetylmuramate dehydrogenase [Gemmatimonadota bacterium]|nr:UDP-N-acetylmuramate dehydrogenase [Gemmatimonadota bacterium]
MKWETDVPLSGLVRYRIGGPAARLGRPETVDEVAAAVRELAGAPYLILGTGANLLVSDAGVETPVLVLGRGLDWTEVSETAIEMGGAGRLPALASAARREAREGFRFLEAVPGTVGGGLRMNAGSRDEWLWHRVEWAEAVTDSGVIERIAPNDAGFGYRTVAVPESWVFVRARFHARPGDPILIGDAHLRFRSRKVGDQVYELPSVGSTWKNPGDPHGSAWEVVERVGMRGARRGDAQIAERHANFIVNHGEARADDVVELMIETRTRAHEQFGIWLEPEIRLWGFPPDLLSQLGAP